MDTEMIVAILSNTVKAGTPILFATIGELFAQRSGVLNLGIEGIMLMSAMTAVAVNVLTEDPLISVFAAGLVGSLMATLHAVLSIRFYVNQIVSGLALVFLGKGLSAFLGAKYVGQQITGVKSYSIPILSDIPVVGRIFFQQDFFVYGSFLLIPLAWLLLYRTQWGLDIRAAGENPVAASFSGVNVQRVRFACVIGGAFLAGIAGAHLSLSYTQMWLQDMVAGRGWIAIVIVIFAMWDPLKALFGAYLFGGLTSLQLNLQAQGVQVSPYLLSMLPYVFTIIVLVFATLRVRKRKVGIPAALGKAYIPEN